MVRDKKDGRARARIPLVEPDHVRTAKLLIRDHGGFETLGDAAEAGGMTLQRLSRLLSGGLGSNPSDKTVKALERIGGRVLVDVLKNVPQEFRRKSA